MKVLGIRFCKVAKREDAMSLSNLLGEKGLGLAATDMGGGEDFQGAVFPVGDGAPATGSWIEVWPDREAVKS